MSTARRLFLTLFLPGLFLQAAALPAASSWPIAADGLTPDPAWQWGVLDNGLRYAIRRNAQPAGHISFRFAVQVGPAEETKAERGFAHFVEHMAFNGTTHFPGESLVADLEKHGVEIGPEVSAFTLLTHTLYILDAPSTAPADLDHWFTVLRDIADGVQFDPRQVKRERGVIASELRDRQSPGSRAELARRRFLYPLSALSNTIEGNVDTTEAKALRQFYDKWYRPERMILVVAGDAEPAALEALVRQHFDSLRARTMPAPRFDPGFIENPVSYTSTVLHDPKVNGLSVEVTSVLPIETADGLALRRQWLARNELIYLLNVRLSEVLRAHPGQLINLAARSTMATPYSIETLIGFTVPSAEWKFGMTTLEQELRRSFEYTFTTDEIREARAAMLTGYEQRAQTSATNRSPELAGDVLQQALWGLVTTAPAADLRQARAWLPEIDALEMNRAWRSLWQERRTRIFGYGFFPVTNGPALLDYAFNESLRQPVTPPTPRPTLQFAYRDFGPPGVIKWREYLPALDIHMLEFANGVRVNLKRTAFEAATVHLQARFGHGMLGEPAGQPALGAMAAATFLNGALGRHNPEELRRILSASAISLNFSAEEEAFAFDGQSPATGVDQLLRLLGAFLTDPGWNPEAVALAAAHLGIYYGDLNFTPEGIISVNAFRTLAGGDPRYSAPTQAQVKARTVDEMRHWLDPQLRSAPLELGLVGDFEIEPTIELLRQTLGALPARGPVGENPPPVAFSSQSAARQYSFQGEANRAGIEVVWPLANCDDIKVSRRSEVLCAVLGERLRLKVRQDLGAAYTPSVSFWKSEASHDSGYVIAYITVKPGDVPRLTKLMIGLADTLGRKGATAEEFAQAREPIIDRSIADQKDNDYWVRHIIAKVQTQPEVRQWPQTRVGDFQAMTLADVNALAHSVLPSAHAITFTALPERK